MQQVAKLINTENKGEVKFTSLDLLNALMDKRNYTQKPHDTAISKLLEAEQLAPTHSTLDFPGLQ